MVTHLHDHVARQHACFGCWRCLQHAGDDDTPRGFDAKGLCQLGRQLIGLYTNPAACDLAVFDQPIHDDLGGGHRNGKPDAHAAARARVDGGVDAQQIAVHINQCPPGVAGVDGGIGLNEVFKRVDAQFAAAQGADNPAGHRLAHAKRVANCQHGVTHHGVV